jgi:hypothetical protein
MELCEVFLVLDLYYIKPTRIKIKGYENNYYEMPGAGTLFWSNG